MRTAGFCDSRGVNLRWDTLHPGHPSRPGHPTPQKGHGTRNQEGMDLDLNPTRVAIEPITIEDKGSGS